MNTTKCPSRMPRLFGLFLIAIVAPAIFVLGFGANKKHQTKPREAAVTLIASKQSAEVTVQKGETVYIYADAFTVHRNDAVYKVEDIDGNEIPTNTLHSQKAIAYDGRIAREFSAIASFIPTSESIRIYCDITSNISGEFLVGEKMSPPSISMLMILFFILGVVVMGLGVTIAVKNVYARKRWFEKHRGR